MEMKVERLVTAKLREVYYNSTTKREKWTNAYFWFL